MSGEHDEPRMTPEERFGYEISSRGDVHRLLLYIDDLEQMVYAAVRYIDVMHLDERCRDYYREINERFDAKAKEE